MADMDWNSDQDWERIFKQNDEFARNNPDDPTAIRKWQRESWRDMAARVVSALGILIIWSSIPHKIGAIISSGIGTPGCAEENADQPFVVTGEATSEHWVRQCDFIGDCAPVPASRDRYFYFVQTD